MAQKIRAFHEAGVRHIVLDLVGAQEEREREVEEFASEVFPLLKDLTALPDAGGPAPVVPLP